MNEDLAIHFDVEQTKEAFVDAEISYMEFLELSESFMGWLLTLDDKEFKYVYDNLTHNFEKDPWGAISFMFAQIEFFHRGQSVVLKSELESAIINHIKGVKIVNLIREGYLNYEVAEKDEDWLISLTEKGQEVTKKYNTYLKELEDVLQSSNAVGSNHNSEQPNGVRERLL